MGKYIEAQQNKVQNEKTHSNSRSKYRMGKHSRYSRIKLRNEKNTQVHSRTKYRIGKLTQSENTQV